ncbi:hypothetical protein J3B02_003529 [Coemansia erecta]|uniref:Uncharacterized protein n=1 Tax=Coemansia asiatica TaxID=1052880 RepID=A0A9W7XGV9_9FUNG|nr:hypothetical protein LPJ64_004964 [Coemansia asiatica]KAJ2851785.1 hypothetical protein J3B02_003529 [Coemansia erecta]KAJ2867396.1 hypothetical protein FB639_004945 [Coemansia asiatica]
MEFSQRPSTYGLAAAPPAHYQHPPDAVDTYPGAPRRLPSLSELLVSQEPAAQQAAVAGHRSRDSASYSMHPHSHSHPHLRLHPQRTAQPFDPSAPHYASAAHHHNSAPSPVSSQSTLIDSFSPVHKGSAGLFAPPQASQLVLGMCEEDVFAAASILMSLRTCKLPC